MHHKFVTDSFHTKELCSRLSSSKVWFYTENVRFGFWAPLWELRGNVQCSCYAHWKAHSGLPISVNWTLFARSYGWRATSKNRL